MIFICDYIFGIPFGMFLVKKTTMGIQGLWLGMLVGVIIQVREREHTRSSVGFTLVEINSLASLVVHFI